MKLTLLAAFGVLLGATAVIASPLSGVAAPAHHHADGAPTQTRAPDNADPYDIEQSKGIFDIGSPEPILSTDGADTIAITDIKTPDLTINPQAMIPKNALEDRNANFDCEIYCSLFGVIIRCLQSPTFCRCDEKGWVHCNGPSQVCLDNCVCRCESKRLAAKIGEHKAITEGASGKDDSKSEGGKSDEHQGK
ncbi:hypothetical protein ACHAQH_004581 [Verticillium albo-atrum]